MSRILNELIFNFYRAENDLAEYNSDEDMEGEEDGEEDLLEEEDEDEADPATELNDQLYDACERKDFAEVKRLVDLGK